MTRKLIGPAHAHLDAPCTDACYQEVREEPVTEHRHGGYDWHPAAEAHAVPAEVSYLETRVKGHPTQLTDGFHTMEELYDHRRALTAALAGAAASAGDSWRSKEHHPDDDPMFEGGYFIVGIQLPTGVITYHYKLTHWDDFSATPEVKHAPKWDGAPPSATVDRLLELARMLPDRSGE